MIRYHKEYFQQLTTFFSFLVGNGFFSKKLLPDVDESVGEVASWITPRLGGVGPTTVAMLLRNTVEAAERKIL